MDPFCFDALQILQHSTRLYSSDYTHYKPTPERLRYSVRLPSNKGFTFFNYIEHGTSFKHIDTVGLDYSSPTQVYNTTDGKWHRRMIVPFHHDMSDDLRILYPNTPLTMNEFRQDGIDDPFLIKKGDPQMEPDFPFHPQLTRDCIVVPIGLESIHLRLWSPQKPWEVLFSLFSHHLPIEIHFFFENNESDEFPFVPLVVTIPPKCKIIVRPEVAMITCLTIHDLIIYEQINQARQKYAMTLDLTVYEKGWDAPYFFIPGDECEIKSMQLYITSPHSIFNLLSGEEKVRRLNSILPSEENEEDRLSRRMEYLALHKALAPDEDIIEVDSKDWRGIIH